MRARLTRLLPALLLICSIATAHAAGPRRVRVALEGSMTLSRLLEAGFDVIDRHRSDAVELLEWPGDAERLAQLGARVVVLDADPGRTAADRARRELSAKRSRTGAAQPDPAGNARSSDLGAGALGGFWTLAEVRSELDYWVASDTRDLVANKLDTLGFSIQGRPILGLQLGKRVVGTDTRPVAFFNSLTHAREPGGMQALMYFLQDLLVRYDTDPRAKYLLDSRRLYFVPVVNPDGYRYNQTIFDSTAAFGFWRKNLRDNNLNGVTGAGDGVDVNRNFGFKWGFNNSGSSGTPANETYRGPSAFSEPETRIQRDVVMALRPIAGFSFHTYSDLLIHPWGWTPAGTPDSLRFQEWNDEMTELNGYAAGPGPRILYEVNGEFNDWTYGDTLLKPKAFTWTPEVGGPDDGFWPPPSRIEPLAKDMLEACYTVAGIAGPWVRVESSRIVEGALNAGNLAHVAVRLRHFGATGSAGPLLKATLTSIDPRAEVLSGAVSYPTLSSFQSAEANASGAFLVAAVDTITPGSMVRFKLEVRDANGLYCRDTVEVLVGTPTTVLVDAAQSLAPWSATGLWGVVNNDARHPSAYIADSPTSAYPTSYSSQLTLSQTLDLSAGVKAWALMDNRWEFESDFDCGLLEVSRNGIDWTSLRGNASSASDANSVVGAGSQVFDGTRWLWHPDRFDLSGFAGGPGASAVRLRFRSLSDAGTNLDGLSFDSLRVLVFDPALQPAPVAVGRSEGAR
ncbi:MAG: M14 family zinc carboxypeptidase, partial [Candidatus Eisenbacteria bacterium]